MFGPLRTLGVPESLIDVVEPFFRVLVDLGYDRTIAPGKPTPARLIPPLDPAKVITDLVAAIGEGINNASAIVGLPSLPSIPAPVTLAGPATQFENADMSRQGAKDAASQTERAMSSDTETSTTTVTETARADASPKDAHAELVNETDPPTSAHTATATEQPTSPDATDTTEATSTTTNAGEPSKPRSMVRDSLRTGQQLPNPSHRGADHQLTTRTADIGAVDASGATSSTASSSRGGTSDSDGDGS
jgi:hypothetical protein